MLAFFPNAPPAPPRCGGRPPPGRCGPPAGAPPAFDLYGDAGAPVDGAPVRGGKPAPAGGRDPGGRAANPGRTEPGRGPDIPGRCGAPPGLCGGRGVVPPVENGLFPGRGGRGTAPPVENGLLPGRGAGFGSSDFSSAIASAACVFADSAFAASTRSCCALSALISTPSSAANSAACSALTSPLGFAAAFLAAAFLTGFFSSAGFASGYISMSLRTTGASTVDDADRTNSPISWSFARTTLLSIPSCFANSCTRTFDTFSPVLARMKLHMQALVVRPHSSNELI